VRVPHREIKREDGCGAAMRSGGMLVHCPGCLGPTASVLAAEFLCGDGVFTKGALESGESAHRFDGVMSHSFIVVAYSGMAPN